MKSIVIISAFGVLLGLAVLPASAQSSSAQTISGQQTLSAADLSALGSVSIGPGSTLYIDFGNGPVNVPSFTNGGTVYAISNNSSTTTAVLNTGSFNNGGTFSSLGNLNLTFNAGSFTNSGLLKSGGDLSIYANSIVNSGTMQAAGNVSLNSASIINSGIISALSGNISINTATLMHDTLVNNANGIIQATNGSINIGSADSDLSNIIATGGDWIAKEINIIANNGTLDFKADSITGILNTSANDIHAGVTSGNLNVGNVNATGDPLYFNTSGSIVVSGDVTVSEALAIIAAQDVQINGANTITARTAGGAGCDITIVAGATFTASTGTDTTSVPGTTSTSATIDANGIGLGGSVLINSPGGVLIDASGTCAGCSGGNVSLIAYAGTSGGGGGAVQFLTGSTVISEGGTGGTNGNISIIGPSFLIAPNLDAANGTAGSGIITINSSQPTSSDGLAVSFNSTGDITSGNTFVPGSTLTNSVQLSSGTTISADSAVNVGATTLLADANISAPTINLTGTSSVTVTSLVTATDGTFNIISPSIANTGDILASGSNPVVSLFSPTATLVLSGSGTISAIDSGGGFGAININDPSAPSTLVTGSVGSLTTDDIVINGDPGYVVNLSVASSSVNAGYDLAPAATSITLTQFAGDITLCACLTTASAGNSNGGNISISAAGGSINALGGAFSNGDGAGNRSGNITMFAFNDINSFGLDASGTGGAAGGNVSLSAFGTVTIFNPIGAAIATGAAPAGGNVTIAANEVQLLGTPAIDTTATAGTAGSVSIMTSSNSPLLIGGCGCVPNSISGSIAAAGQTGGRVTLSSTPGMYQIDPTFAIDASGLDGGQILFTRPFGGALSVVNDGSLIATGTNTPGTLAFSTNGALAVPITVSGTGTVTANTLSFADTVDPTTLLPAQFPLNLPPSNPFVHNGFNNINASFGSLTADTFVVRGNPPPPPTPLVVPTPPAPVVPPPVVAEPAVVSQSVVELGNLPSVPNELILPTDQQSQFLNVRDEQPDNTLQAYISEEVAPVALVDIGRFIHADEDLVIKTSLGQLHLAQGSAVFLIDGGSVVSIYNLHDNSDTSVSFFENDHRTPIPIGVQLLVSRSHDTFNNLNPTPSIGTRLVSQTNSGSLQLAAAEFSMVSAMREIPAVRALAQDNTNKLNNKLHDKIMRNAAILMVLTAQHGNFKQAFANRRVQ